MEIDYSRQYTRLHNTNLEHAQGQARGYGVYLDHLALPASTRLLDVGCGFGFFLLAARQRGLQHAIGIDNSPQQISAARGLGLPAEHVADSNAWLRERPGAFDAICLFDVLEHIPVAEQIGFLSALREALRPGGTLLVRVPNANSTFAGRMRWGDWTHHCVFNEYSLDFVLHNAGFADIRVRDDHFSKYPLWMPRPSAIGVLRALHFGVRRLQAAAEYGWDAAREMPLTFNIVATACRPTVPIGE